MKKFIYSSILISSIIQAEPIVTNDIIYGSVINSVKSIPKATKNLILYTTNDKEKNSWWYFYKNQKLKAILKKHNIKYYPILKMRMYPLKTYNNSREAEKKKYEILMDLIQRNDIKIEEDTTKPEKQKHKLHIEMRDK